MNIITDLIPIGNNRRGLPMIAQFITMHETGNSAVGADAAMHNRFIRSADNVARPASWHFTVDDHSIYQHVPTNEQAIHAGRLLGNQISIGIEMCINSDGDFEQTKKNAQELVARLLIELNLTKDKIVQHNRWSGKDCPATIRRTGTWQLFLDGIITEEDMATIAELTAQVKTLTTNNATLRTALDAERRKTKALEDDKYDLNSSLIDCRQQNTVLKTENAAVNVKLNNMTIENNGHIAEILRLTELVKVDVVQDAETKTIIQRLTALFK